METTQHALENTTAWNRALSNMINSSSKEIIVVLCKTYSLINNYK